MKFGQILAIIALSAAVSFATFYAIGPRSENQTTAAKETTYDRIMRTGTIRCAYLIFNKFTDRDPNTKALSGIYVDLMEEIGKQLSLKIEWTEEVGSGNAFEGLKTNRYDMVCVPFSTNPTRARVTEFTIPTAYLPYRIYARADDTRFDNNFDKINNPSIKVSLVDGELGQLIKEQDFPKASAASMPSLTDISQDLVQVMTGKADVAFLDTSLVETFMATNPGKIKAVAGPPIRMQSVGLSLPVGEEALKSMINTTLEVLHGTGFIARLYEKYLGPQGFHYNLPAQPWQTEQEKRS